MIRLVVNADDFGLHPKIDEGILCAHKEGVVTSATLIVNGSNAQNAVLQALKQGLALGLHFCLCTGLPPAAPADRVRHLAPNRRFRPSWSHVVRAYALGQIPKEEIDCELRAQLELAKKLGVTPDHLDAHQHLHLLPGIAPIVEQLASEEGLPVRWPFAVPRFSWIASPGNAVKSTLLSALALWRGCSSHGARKIRSLGIFEAGRLNERQLCGLLQTLRDGDFEIGCHPGKTPGVVPEDPGWQYQWEDELAAMCSRKAWAVVNQRNIVLTTYAGLSATKSTCGVV